MGTPCLALFGSLIPFLGEMTGATFAGYVDEDDLVGCVYDLIPAYMKLLEEEAE